MRIDNLPQSFTAGGSSKQAGGSDIFSPAVDKQVNIPGDNLPGQQRIGEKELITAIEKANKKLEIYDTRLQFSIHEKTKQIMVKIVDVNNDEIIKELPPEKILDLVAKMMEMAGILIDERT